MYVIAYLEFCLLIYTVEIEINIILTFCDKGGKIGTPVSYGHISSLFSLSMYCMSVKLIFYVYISGFDIKLNTKKDWIDFDLALSNIIKKELSGVCIKYLKQNLMHDIEIFQFFFQFL